MADAYAALLERIKDIGKLDAIDALLEWDQDTYMPTKGVAARAEMSAMVAGLKHDRRSSPELGDLLGKLDDGPSDDPVRDTNVRETRRLHQRAINVPTSLVQQIARTSAMAKQAWVQARREDVFGVFAPKLTEMIELKRQQADAIGYAEDPYDALMDEYEPGASSAEIAELFSDLRGQLVPLIRTISDAPSKPDFSILQRHYPRPAQESLARFLAGRIGFDFEAGRLDVSVHPFCLSMGGGDVRLTTRYDERFFSPAIFGVMHEVGHGLYEQGLPAEHAFTPMGSYTSLGIHESQSRFWENNVGRSEPFWRRHFNAAQDLFPEALGSVSVEEFHRAINTVAPSLIRVEADEVTYNLHIIVRFELERDIVNNRLSVADIPDAWNQKMTETVGITPADNATGCLQDIHWSLGAFGYFPTYALGNLYAAQFFASARKAMGNLDERIAAGDCESLLDWLRTNVHRHGMRYRAGELCRQVTGRPLSIHDFMDYVNTKFKRVYQL